MQEVGQSALFGARFRENAARALLIPRRRPDQRTPLWQQRLKAQGLLQVARRYGSFPIILETYRECLQDVFDLPALKRLLARAADARARSRRRRDGVGLARIPPRSSSTTSRRTCTRTTRLPRSGARQALSLDRDLLRELLGQEELRDLLDAGAARGGRGAAARQSTQRRISFTISCACAETCVRASTTKASPRRCCASGALVLVRFAGRATADRRRGCRPLPRRARRDAARRAAGGVPRGRRRRRSTSSWLRYARGRGPFTTAQANERFGRDVEPLLQQLERQEKLVRGELRPGGTEREWCDPDVLRRLRRASLAALRKEVEPAEQAAFGRFLPHWHGIDRRATLREALVPLRDCRCRSRSGSPDVLPRRVPGFNPGSSTSSAHPAKSCGSARGSTVSPSSSARTRRRSVAQPPRLGPRARRTTRSARRSDAAQSSGTTCVASTGLEAEVALPALWDLVWAGEVTNDAWTPLRAGRRYQSPTATQRGRPRRFSRQRSAGITATQGRWSLTDKLFPGRPDARAPRRTAARTSRNRHPRRRPRRRDPRRVRRGVRRAACARDARRLPARLLRRRASAAPSSPSPARSSDCASCVRARTRSRNRSSLPPRTRHSRTVLACPGRSAQGARGACRRCAGRPARRPGRRSSSSAAARSLVPLRDPEDDWLRVALDGARRARQEGRVEETPGGRALRRRARRRDRDHAALLLEAGFLAGPRRAVLRP